MQKNLSHTLSLSVSKPQLKKKKNNLGDVPVSQQTAEARVLFTWVTHDKTRTAGCQEETGDSSILGIRLCVMVKKAPVALKAGR